MKWKGFHNGGKKMKLKKIVAMFLMTAMTVGALSGCGNPSGNSNNEANEGSGNSGKVEVTMLGTIKAEIGPAFEDAVAAYNASQDKYEVVTMPLDGNAFERMTALYASGNTPTIMAMGQEANEFSDKLLDVSDQPLLQDAQEGSYDLVTTEDGKVIGFPITVEAFGLLYNKTVMDEVAGGTFDSTTVDSQDSLKQLYADIEAAGKGAVHISPLDWSLGAHLTNLMFAPQSENPEEARSLIDGLKAGDVKLIENEVFNGWLDTFDILKEHNTAKASPLAPTYEDGGLEIGMGDTATWFQGNWTLPMLQEVDSEVQLGIMPFPVSNDSSTYGNTQVSVGVPMYLSIDNENATEEEQAGAIDFINWLFTSDEGQVHYVENMKFIPVYKSVTAQPEDTLSQEILKYMNDSKTLPWINMYYPGDAGAALGATLQKYLDDVITREEVAAEFEAYWAGKAE